MQVHPNDEYAIKHENDLGKPESWIVLDCPANSEIIYGHTAQTKEEFIDLIKAKNWKKLLKTQKINKGDFIYVPPGKIHAITSGIKVFELQRSSDVTYRLYDYDRLDNGSKRELQVEKSIDNITFPDRDDLIIKNATEKVFSSEFFSIYIFDSKQHKSFRKYENASWIQLTVIEGEGEIENKSFKKENQPLFLVDLNK